MEDDWPLCWGVKATEADWIKAELAAIEECKQECQTNPKDPFRLIHNAERMLYLADKQTEFSYLIDEARDTWKKAIAIFEENDIKLHNHEYYSTLLSLTQLCHCILTSRIRNTNVSQLVDEHPYTTYLPSLVMDANKAIMSLLDMLDLEDEDSDMPEHFRDRALDDWRMITYAMAHFQNIGHPLKFSEAQNADIAKISKRLGIYTEDDHENTSLSLQEDEMDVTDQSPAMSSLPEDEKVCVDDLLKSSRSQENEHTKLAMIAKAIQMLENALSVNPHDKKVSQELENVYSELEQIRHPAEYVMKENKRLHV